MIGLEIRGITKRFGATTALDGINLSIDEGELFFLLGPSGCGKTTLLRIIAGFCRPDSGEVLFQGADLLAKNPEDRNVGMVFQNYALWPHMTVFENVAYGLRMRGLSRKQINKRVKPALEMVDMAEYGERKPAGLSGGEQQRIALARAVVYEPELVLLDEPLSNLDAKLRKDMRAEIRALHDRLGVTMVYVTHDQEEAASMADRIALFSKGTLQQVDKPENLYRRPLNRYVADFFGHSNAVEGTVAAVHEQTLTVQFGPHRLQAAVECDERTRYPVGTKVALIIRPEDIRLRLEEQAAGENILSGRIAGREFLGAYDSYRVDIGGGHILTVTMPSGDPGRPSTDREEGVTLFVDRTRIHILGGRA
ncbi:MAG: ABC transporter ATP-binding protein [Planctomycetota bacterium]